MERETGIEPAPSAWKAEVLPLNYSRTDAEQSAARSFGTSSSCRQRHNAVGGRWITPGILPSAPPSQPCRPFGFAPANPSNRRHDSVVLIHLRETPYQLAGWWREVDSNHRRRKPADLQSAPVGRLGIPPTKNKHCPERIADCQQVFATAPSRSSARTPIAAARRGGCRASRAAARSRRRRAMRTDAIGRAEDVTECPFVTSAQP